MHTKTAAQTQGTRQSGNICSLDRGKMGSQGIQIPGSFEVPDIPSGLEILRKLPYAFILPEVIFGAWVWILVAATNVHLPDNQGWVMYVAVSSFFFSLILLMVYLFGIHKNNCSTWRIVDVIYHGITAIFYLSAAVLQANATIRFEKGSEAPWSPVKYHLDAAATIFAFITTLLYVLHSFQSYVQ
ncbi:MAL-like protein [Rhinatrema bivittatum]|uniref:MAL-like protein n=1 Tax=Rhinatrema bivittatum TaxID=194408 RepID=UPI00112CB7B7|nr:MAL-like protein [Rhinatrema bivittatum]